MGTSGSCDEQSKHVRAAWQLGRAIRRGPCSREVDRGSLRHQHCASTLERAITCRRSRRTREYTGSSIWSVPCYRGRSRGPQCPSFTVRGTTSTEWREVERLMKSHCLPSHRATRLLSHRLPRVSRYRPRGRMGHDRDRPDFLARFGSAFGDVVVTSRADASLPGAYALMSDGRSPYARKTTGLARQALARGTIAVWQIAKTGVRPSAISYPLVASQPQISRPLADTFSAAFFARAPQPGSIVVLHQRSTAG